MPGFLNARLVLRDDRAPICFIDFIDATSATYAMNMLQGYKLEKSLPGIVIEFDRATQEKERNQRESSYRRH